MNKYIYVVLMYFWVYVEGELDGVWGLLVINFWVGCNKRMYVFGFCVVCWILMDECLYIYFVNLVVFILLFIDWFEDYYFNIVIVKVSYDY